MKKLKKILLINWLYFAKQLIEVEDINFITGKNGAGKSTIIDALQIVLLGETNARIFNQAANEKSQRTLDGYLRADMDEKSPYNRRGKDFCAYIACEFWDDVEGTQFTAGVVFDCRNDGTHHDHFFLYSGVIPPDCYVTEGQAMDVPAFRGFLKQNYGTRGKLFDTQKQYRIDLLSKWNVHNEQAMRMMKKAVSFRPIVDIQKFITENICDIPDKPDVDAMQQNIRDYKRNEKLALRQEEKLKALREIGKLHREMQMAMERWQQQQFLVLWAQKESLEQEIQSRIAERKAYTADIQAMTAEIKTIQETIERKEQRRNELSVACMQSDVSQEQIKLENQLNRLQQEQNRLAQLLQRDVLALKREAVRIDGLCREVLGLKCEEPVAELQDAAEEARKAYAIFMDCDETVFAKDFSVFEKAQQATVHLTHAMNDAAYTMKAWLDKRQAEVDEMQLTLQKLKQNEKDYPKGLLQLKAELLSAVEAEGYEKVHIDVLADVLEIVEREEHWRSAVEGYLGNQKFYLLVQPEQYPAAVKAYEQLRKRYGAQSFGLVDIGKLREKERLVPMPDSLACKIETKNSLARSYVDYLLGRVVCCEHTEQLRKHKIAITAEGMLYQGYVVRPIQKERMEEVYIGRRAISLRRSRLEQELAEAKSEMGQRQPVYETLVKAQNLDVLMNQHFVQVVITQNRAEYLYKMDSAGELARVEDQLSHLDLFWLQEQQAQIKQLKEEIAELDERKSEQGKQMGRLEERVQTLEEKVLPEKYQALEGKKDLLEERFTPEFVQDIGLPRYRQELKRLGKPETVSKNFNDQLMRTVNEQENAKQRLFRARAEYVDRFKPCAFQVERMDNEQYEAEQKLLEESELPKYREKITAARDSALEQFRNDFLAKLKSSIDQVREQVRSLNRALSQAQFGTDRYQFRVDRNPDYAEYYDMIMAPELMEGDVGLLAMPFQQKYGELIEQLFSQITMADDTQLNARQQSEMQQNIERYTDFRTYLKFDLETTDQNGSKQLLSQTLNTKSGGETQTPFYIAVLASFAQLYQVNNLSSAASNTVRLVVFDEAFNKMDSDRIMESVRLLRKMGLQAIICTPPDKLSDIMPLADRTHLVVRDRYQMHVRTWGKERAKECTSKS